VGTGRLLIADVLSGQQKRILDLRPKSIRALRRAPSGLCIGRGKVDRLVDDLVEQGLLVGALPDQVACIPTFSDHFSSGEALNADVDVLLPPFTVFDRSHITKE